MELKHLKGNTYYLDTDLCFIPVYKINDTDIIMLDSGWRKGQEKDLDMLLDHLGLCVKGVICTHNHIDHTGNNIFLRRKYGAVIAMPEAEATLASSYLSLKLLYYNLDYSVMQDHLESMVFDTDIKIPGTQKELELFGVCFRLIHLPGHSVGHMCIVTPDDICYLGDMLISESVMISSKMPYAFVLSEDLKSKEKLFDFQFSKYVVAHRGIYEDVQELTEKNIRFYKERAAAILALITRPMEMDELVGRVFELFKIHTSSLYKYALIERMLRAYLDYLIEMGLVKKVLYPGKIEYVAITEA